MGRYAIILTAIAVLIVMSAGCATIISGSTKRITFTSQPAGATVSVKDYQRTTPCKIRLKRKKSYDVRFEKEGYEPVVMKIKRGFNPWFIGNLLLGGLIGMLVDAATGAMYTLTPSTLDANMQRTVQLEEPESYYERREKSILPGEQVP